MVNRATLIKELDGSIAPSPTQRESIRKAQEKALIEAVQALPLTAARKLSTAHRSDLEIVLKSLSDAQAKAMSALWEPKRKLQAADADIKQVVKSRLVELLSNGQSPYEPITVSLEEARKGDRAFYSAIISQLAPTADLKSLLKKWDKHYAPVPQKRAELSKRLVALLNGQEPAPAPQRPPARRR